MIHVEQALAIAAFGCSVAALVFPERRAVLGAVGLVLCNLIWLLRLA